MPNKRIEQPWERQKGESPQAFEAFLTYLQMGADRSLRAVGQKLGKSDTLLGRWSSAYHWVERCRAWDNHLQQEARKAAIAEIREMNKRHIDAAVLMQGAVLRALQKRGDKLITDKNVAAVLKLATELERTSRIAEVAAETENLKKAEEDGDGSVVKIICDIPSSPPSVNTGSATPETTPEEGDSNNADK